MADVILSNLGTTPINGWEVWWQLPQGVIIENYASDVVKLSGLNPYIAFPLSNGPNYAINPGSSVRFSFTARNPAGVSLQGTEVMGSICENSTPPPANNLPLAALALSSAATSENALGVHFDAGGSADPDGGDSPYNHDSLTYSWDFGDGTASGPTSAFWAAHQYTVPAGAPVTRTATLTVNDSRGGSDTASITFTLVPQIAPLGCSAQPVSSSNTEFRLDTRMGNGGSTSLSNPCVSLRFYDPVQITGSTGGTVTSLSPTIKKVCLNGALNPGQRAIVGVQGTHDGSYDSSTTCHISVP